MPHVSREIIALPKEAQATSSDVFDTDVDASGQSLLVIGSEKRSIHVAFGADAPLALPVPLFSGRGRLLDAETALVWGTRKLSHEEPSGWIIKRNGDAYETFGEIQYCADAFCTERYIVLTYFEDHMGIGNPTADEGLAVFDQSGRLLWGWNQTVREAMAITDCDAAVHVDGDLIGVFASSEFPLVVFDLRGRRPAAIHHPVPSILHGARAISTRGDVWYFIGPYEAKDAIFSWRPSRNEPELVGRVSPHQRYRGLSDGRFVCVNGGTAMVLAMQ